MSSANDDFLDELKDLPATPWSGEEKPDLSGYDIPTLSNAFQGFHKVPGYGDLLHLIRPEGSGANRLLLLGEAGGKNEQADLLPFRPYAAAGSVLERALREKGIERKDCLISNTVYWQPRGNSVPTPEARAFCRGLNIELIKRHGIRCIVALGRTAFEEVTGLSEINVINGRGFINRALPDYGGIPVILTYHPSYLARGSGKGREDEQEGAKVKKAEGGGLSLLWVLKRDIELGLRIARNGAPVPKAVEAVYNPEERQWQEFYDKARADKEFPISYDFENAYSLILSGDEDEYEERDYRELTQVQLSLTDDVSYIADWNNNTETWFKRFMELPNNKLDVNGRHFDRRYVRAMNCVPQGKFIDLQSLWHHWQPDLPRNLQYISSFFAPERGQWKHLMGRDMIEYGKFDSTNPLLCMTWLYSILDSFPKHPVSGIDLLSGYETQVLDVELQCLDRLERRGIPVNRERQIELGKELQGLMEEYNRKVQELVPEVLRPNKQKEGLKGAPPEWLRVIREKIEACKTELKQVKRAAKIVEKTWKGHGVPVSEAKAIDRRNYLMHHLAVLEQTRELGPRTERWETTKTNDEGEEEKVTYEKRTFLAEDGFPAERWCRLEEFNANSSKQLIGYIEFKKDEAVEELNRLYQNDRGVDAPKTKIEAIPWRVPMTKDDSGGLRPTTGKAEILKLFKKTQDPLLECALGTREVGKIIGTYVGGEGKITMWTPGEDGLVHPFYNTFPATGQLSARDPNALNYPKHNKKYFEKVRSIVKAPPGRCIVECIDPNTKVLTARMFWKPAKTLKVGDDLVGFSEELQGDGPRPFRKTERSTITGIVSINRPKLKIKTTHGEITVSTNHLFLGRRRGVQWIRADDLKVDDQLSFFTPPWEADYSSEASYLAGFLDGEGYVGKSGRVGFGQNPGSVSDYVCDALSRRGSETVNQSSRKCEAFDIRSGVPFTGWRLIGTLRPIRLMENLQKVWEGRAIWGKRTTRAKVLSIESVGDGEVLAISTTSKTLITEGFLSHNCDYKAFHVLTTGFEAGCPIYMRLARLDMHSFFAATQLLRLYKAEELLKETDFNMSTLFKELRRSETKHRGKTFQQIRDKEAKPTILGWGFGMMPGTLYRNNEESFEDEAHAKRTHMGLEELFPVVSAWKKNVIQEADEKGYLLTSYGFIRWFNCVYHKRLKKPGEWIKPGTHFKRTKYGDIIYEHGDDHESCVAYRPANDAFGMTRDVYLEIEKIQEDGRCLAEEWWFSIPLHDALILFPKWEQKDECLQGVKRMMEAESRCLRLPDGTGLICQAEAMMSDYEGSWADMKEIRL